MVRNTYIYPPSPFDADDRRYFPLLLRRTCRSSTAFRFAAITCRKRERRADIELAYTLADGLEYMRTGIAGGPGHRQFAPRLSFFWGIGMNHFMEIAKMRAARILWAKIMKSFNPKNPKSMALRTHSQTSGWSLTAQDVFNNVIRTTAWKRWRRRWAIRNRCTPTRWTKRLRCRPIFRRGLRAIRRSTCRKRRGSTKVVDPWAGSYYVESLTHELMQKAWHLIQEVEELGGMTKAIETGTAEDADRRSGGAAAGEDRFRPRNDRRRQQVHGWRAKKRWTCWIVDNAAVRESQLRRLAEIRAARDEQAVEASLDALTKCAEAGDRESAGTGGERGAPAGDAGRNFRRRWRRCSGGIRR